MKQLMLAAAFAVISLSIFGQSPAKMSYQAVVRDVGNNLVSSSPVGIRISLLQGSAFGASVYVETHTPTTNANGLATIEIGSGTIVLGNLSTIDWGAGPYFLKTETDPSGGTSYSISGTTQLLSVPYALHAAVADSVVNGSTSDVRAYLYLKKKATLQSIPSATASQIGNYDLSSASGISVNMTTGVITFDQTGYYMITVQTSFEASSPGRKLVWLNCTSSNWPARIGSNEQSSDANRITTSFMGLFNAGDQISLGVAQYTGVTVNCPSNTQTYDQTYLNIERLF